MIFAQRRKVLFPTLFTLFFYGVATSAAWSNELPASQRQSGAASPAPSMEMPQVTFYGRRRACAGGVNDEVHRLRLRIEVRRKGMAPANEPVSFSFEGDGANSSRPPRFRDERGQWKKSWTARTDAGGVVHLVALSGAEVSKPQLVARWNGREVGRVTCDFGEAISYRRFPNPADDEYYGVIEDNGVLPYNSPHRPGEEGLVKFYFKFKIDAQRGDVKGNWQVVNGHRMLIRIDSIELQARRGSDHDVTITDPAQVAKYATIVDPKNPEATTCTVVTSRDGSAQVRVRGGPKLTFNEQIYVDAVDLTQVVDEADEVLPCVPRHTLAEAAFDGPMIEWFTLPRTLRGLLLYGVGKPFAQRQFVLESIDGSRPKSREKKTVLDLSALEDKQKPEDSRSAYNAQISPDGRRALFHVTRPGQYMDNCHDLYVADLQTGTYREIKDYLFGASEKWSSDGDAISYIEGSLDMIFSQAVDPIISLKVFDLKKNAERVILSDNTTLATNGVVWSGKGDLLFSVNPGMTYNTSWNPKRGPRPVVFRAHAGQSTPRPIIFDGHEPVPSPDSNKIAFFGPEDMQADELSKWRYERGGSSLIVANADGTHRRVLSRFHRGQPAVYWTPDSRHLITAHSWQDETILGIRVRQWDIGSGGFRILSEVEIKLPPGKNAYSGPYRSLSPRGLSRDGRYLFLHFGQAESQKNTSLLKTARSWLALNLNTGQVRRLAIFRGVDGDWLDQSDVAAR